MPAHKQLYYEVVIADVNINAHLAVSVEVPRPVGLAMTKGDLYTKLVITASSVMRVYTRESAVDAPSLIPCIPYTTS